MSPQELVAAGVALRPQHGPAGPLLVDLDVHAFQVGDVMSPSRRRRAGFDSDPVDVYLVLRIPGGALFSL